MHPLRVVPINTSMAWLGLAMVALMPHSNMGLPFRLWSTACIHDQASSTCTPLLLPTNACHSSTTIISIDRNSLELSRCAINTCNDSGVVTRMSGNRDFWAAFTLLDVSPVLVPTSQFSPSPSTMRSAALAMSEESARSGEIHRTFNPARSGFPTWLASTWPSTA